jgi:hypothetical protein
MIEPKLAFAALIIFPAASITSADFESASAQHQLSRQHA